MTPAEFNGLRLQLGFNVAAVAELLEINKVTTARLCTGKNIKYAIPDNLAEKLITARDEINHIKNKVVDYIFNSNKKSIRLITPGSSYVCSEYFNEFPYGAAVHNTLCSKIQEILLKKEIDVRIIYLKPGKYAKWLEEKGFENSQVNRSLWALEQEI